MGLLQYTSNEMFSSTELVRKNKYIFDKLNKNEIEKAIILCEGNVIRPKDIFVKQTWSPQLSTVVPNLEEVERQAIETAIRQNDGNLTATAEQLGISRQTLYNKIKRFKL